MEPRIFSVVETWLQTRALMPIRAEVHEVQYLLQDHGAAFQTTPFTGSQVSLWSDPTFQLPHNVVVLLARQMGCRPTTSIFSEHTSKQSSLESLELAELSNDRVDIVPGVLVEGVSGKGWTEEMPHLSA